MIDQLVVIDDSAKPIVVTGEDMEAVMASGLLDVAHMMGQIARVQGPVLMSPRDKVLMRKLYRVSQWGEIPEPIRAAIVDEWNYGWSRGI